MLEGSIAVTGAAVQWLRDQLGLIAARAEVEELARSVPDNGGVYFVPAFSGLFAPHWRDDARGVIVGLTAYARAGHMARAALEATAWQIREVLDAAKTVAEAPLGELRVDGGMTADELLMQFQADVLGIPVCARGHRDDGARRGVCGRSGGRLLGRRGELRERWREDRRWEPQMERGVREREYAQWRKAVERSLDWYRARLGQGVRTIFSASRRS